MRNLPPTKSHTAGFTLVEVLVIAPIIILVIGAFLALIMAMIGDVLITRDHNALTYDTQDALERIEQDTRISTQFLTTSRSLVSPQGSDGGTAAFTSSNALIMATLATDKNPASSDRQLIYYANQPNPCGSTQAYNTIFLNRTIYFVKNGSLWRRTVVPTFNTNATPNTYTVCATPWQQNSCSPGYTTTPPCQTNDVEVMKNVGDFTVKYYSSATGTTPLTGSAIADAESIEVTITGSKTTSGTPFTATSNVRLTKLNDVNADVPTPTAPEVSYTYVDPASVEFTWPAVANATSYEISYQINSGTAITNTVGASTTSYLINAGRNDIVSMNVTAVNITGASPVGNATATIPGWTDAQLMNGWVYYATPYATAGYTKTPYNTVSLKGLIKSGSTTLESVIFTLPEGYRPEYRTIFIVGSYMGGTSGYGRIDVLPSGQVRFLGGTNNWISLDSITFRAAGTATWTNLTYQNGWSYFGAPYPVLRASKDPSSRVFIEGMIKAGTTTSGTAIAGLPSGYQPTYHHIFPANDGTTIGSFGVYNSNNIVARGMYSSFISTNAMYMPSSYSNWTNLPLLNGWVYYGTPHTSAQFTKTADGMVTVKGLIKSGTITNATNIAQLPAGYRPKERLMFPAIANQAYARMDVKPDGYISIEGGGNAGFMSLDSISFIADQ